MSAHSFVNRLAIAFMAFGILLAWGITPASAQLPGEDTLAVASTGFVGMAMPEGDPAAANVTISYDCGAFADGTTIALTASAPEDAMGVATITPVEVTAMGLPTNCEPGNKVLHTAVVTYEASKDEIDGTEVTVTMTAQAPAAVEGVTDPPAAATAEKKATVGPYLEVAFATPEPASFEAEPGTEITGTIPFTTNSNGMVMAMPDLPADKRPPGWDKEALPKTFESPLAGGSGSGVLDFKLMIPLDAEAGEHEATLVVFAHTMGAVTLQTENQEFPITVMVKRAAKDKDAEEGPGFGVLPVVLIGLALAALARRH